MKSECYRERGTKDVRNPIVKQEICKYMWLISNLFVGRKWLLVYSFGFKRIEVRLHDSKKEIARTWEKKVRTQMKEAAAIKDHFKFDNNFRIKQKEKSRTSVASNVANLHNQLRSPVFILKNNGNNNSQFHRKWRNWICNFSLSFLNRSKTKQQQQYWC